jgi:putative addiction module killer protein
MSARWTHKKCPLLLDQNSKGLFELRERRFGLRIYYGFKGEFVVIVLAAGDKKSQEKDITAARTHLSKLEE